VRVTSKGRTFWTGEERVGPQRKKKGILGSLIFQEFSLEGRNFGGVRKKGNWAPNYLGMAW